jgi:putative nucleotidyltransferase with HDIG domain
MRNPTTRYVIVVWLVSALLVGYSLIAMPPASEVEKVAVLLMCALALIAEALTFLLPNAAQGSIGFIAYLAAVLISPSSTTILAATALKGLFEAVQKRSLVKKSFNIAQFAITISLAVIAYASMGGSSLLELRDRTLLLATQTMGAAAVAAFAVSMLTNNVLVVGVIAVSSRKRWWQVFRETKLPTLGVDLLAGPIIFIFAWVYTAFGSIAAIALWVPVLGFRQLNKTNLELEQMNEELLQLMVKSIEARDPYTSGHSRRVQDYAVTIARGARLAERDVDRVSQAALLHDVGKINEKYHPILTKPDRLTPEEWAIMKEHPVDGANLVSTMTRLRHLLPAIRHHHENWDGTGYPDRIAGELIPLEARIIALADTIDAMSSARPYRPGLAPEQVRAEIVRCRGRQFDPKLSDIVLSNAVWSRLFQTDPAAMDSDNSRALRLVKERLVAV